MKYYLLLIFILLLFSSCRLIKSPSDQYQKNNLYKVYRIDSINSYYSIYCEKNDLRFKIISKKGMDDSKKPWITKVGESYNFTLQIFPAENKSNPLANSALIVNCYILEENTEISKESGINGLYTTLFLYGLFYNKKT